MGDPPKGNEALVVSLLISIINARARKQVVALVFVGECRGNAGIGRAKGTASVAQLREIDIRLITVSCGVVACVIERNVDIARDRVHREPLVKAVHIGNLIGYCDAW